MMPIASPHAEPEHKVLVLACGALAKEIIALTRLHGLAEVTLECLPASLHNEPAKIPAAVDARLRTAVHEFDRVLIGYADCGTGGLLDDVCRTHGVTRLPGVHCYEFFTGRDRFAALHDDDPTTFYLTDYLAKHFDRIIGDGLGISAHPELIGMYFANYRNLIYLAQTDDPAVEAAARDAADRLGLAFSVERTGYGDLTDDLVQFVELSRRGVDPRSVATPGEVEAIRLAAAAPMTGATR